MHQVVSGKERSLEALMENGRHARTRLTEGESREEVTSWREGEMKERKRGTERGKQTDGGKARRRENNVEGFEGNESHHYE